MSPEQEIVDVKRNFRLHRLYWVTNLKLMIDRTMDNTPSYTIRNVADLTVDLI